ncbi:MAG: glycosyltransferase [Candidatus Moranbacteria bacterium]|nr:glycosyltransferase [Candidatus Moranbacteria bacterium]
MKTSLSRKDRSKPLVSVVIRTKNEEKYLRMVLDAYARQTFKDFEVLIVDDHSVDGTCGIAESRGCRVAEIPEGKFSHPFSCNFGAGKSIGRYIVFTNGHSIPVSNTFLDDGLRNFEDDNVAGVFALPIAHADGTIADKLIYNIAGYTVGAIRYRIGGLAHLLIGPENGILGTTNAMIRKDLWTKYPFDENINGGWGGEDADWAWHFVSMGYRIVHDPKFRVRHSHHLRVRDLFWQFRNWRRMVSSEQIPERQRKNF